MVYIIIMGVISIIGAIRVYRAGGERHDLLELKMSQHQILSPDRVYTPEKKVVIKELIRDLKRTIFRDKVWGGFIALCILIAISAVTPTIVTGVSYSNYIDAKVFNTATHFQYEQAIRIYSNKSLMKPEAQEAATDFKYASYQGNIAKLICDYRNATIRYNGIVTGKNIWKDNIMFGWFIIELDSNMKEHTLK